ncbi:MAG: peptidoglycan-binding protein [Candidatus Omnitrophica bacterium]|nr:peptidoglycan-binding protein [Candidatus Omnitrophota bacterium]
MDSANETEAETYQAKEKSPLSNTDIQTALQNAGYYSGSIDGKIGPNTERATREFQKNNGLTPDGVIGPKTENMLIKYLSQSLDQD